MNVMESSCGGWTRGSAGGGFLFNPEHRQPGLVARTPLKLPICPAPVSRLAPYPLADSCSQLSSFPDWYGAIVSWFPSAALGEALRGNFIHHQWMADPHWVLTVWTVILGLIASRKFKWSD